MSYILDALQKSDRERQRGKVPDLSAQHDNYFPQEEARPRWPWLLAGTMIACTAVLSYVFWPQDKLVQPHNEPLQSYPDGIAKPTKGADDQRLHVPTEDLPKRLPERTTALSNEPSALIKKVTLSSPRAVAPQENPVNPVPNRANELTQQQTASVATTESTATPESAEQGVVDVEAYIRSLPSINELADGVSARLPALEFTTHIYSTENEKSFVMVNGALLVEGENINQSLALVKILPEHVVLEFEGEQFHMESLKRWRK